MIRYYERKILQSRHDQSIIKDDSKVKMYDHIHDIGKRL
jgi:hypothetical protein